VETPDPFHCTTDPLTNPDPVTVSGNVAPPAVIEVGLTPEIIGAGAATVNVIAFDVGAPELTTVITAVP
jgi:hypothetical protein